MRQSHTIPCPARLWKRSEVIVKVYCWLVPVQDGPFNATTVVFQGQFRDSAHECASGTGIAEHRHKIVDWEAGALFWKVQRSHGKDWEGPFRAKLEQRLPEDDLMFLMGTIHRFPDQWLIVSLIYPPKRRPESQGSLF